MRRRQEMRMRMRMMSQHLHQGRKHCEKVFWKLMKKFQDDVFVDDERNVFPDWRSCLGGLLHRRCSSTGMERGEVMEPGDQRRLKIRQKLQQRRREQRAEG